MGLRQQNILQLSRKSLQNIVLRSEKLIQCTIVTPSTDGTICHTNMEVASTCHHWLITNTTMVILPDMVLGHILTLTVLIRFLKCTEVNAGFCKSRCFRK